MKPLQLAVVDDHPLFREGVVRSLTDLGFEVVGEGTTAEDAISLSRIHRPDILISDISLPGGGLNAVAPVLAGNPSQKIVLLTVSESIEDAAKALNLGAKGYVLKGVGARALAEILRRVAAGETYVSPVVSARMLVGVDKKDLGANLAHPLHTLTKREREVLELVSSGMSNKQVALKLELQEKTVKYHMTRVMAKLGVRNRTAAAVVLHSELVRDGEPSAAKP
jgi:two-component system nitrate/nitrite response regulator NarL